MPHLVIQPRISRNLRLAGPSTQKVAVPRQVAARAQYLCDYYLRLPSGTGASQTAPSYVQFAKSICPVNLPEAPELVAAAETVSNKPASAASPSLPATLGALQVIGLASAMGSVMGGQAGADIAVGGKKSADASEQVALALPGAILGGLTGLALAGRVLAVLLPAAVHIS